jgi:DNA-directed RNA polymerase subunit beta'
MINSNQEFDYIKINLASPARIKEWGQRLLPNGQIIGEVKKPETINYRTFKPEMNGLFCERIFGPVKNWECHCGKFKRVRYRGLVCDKCGVEITESRVRRHRMGFIDLASPISHIWYIKSLANYIGILLDLKRRSVETIVYFCPSDDALNMLSGVEENQHGSIFLKEKLKQINVPKEVRLIRQRITFLYDLINLVDSKSYKPNDLIEQLESRTDLDPFLVDWMIEQINLTTSYSANLIIQKAQSLFTKLRILEKFMTTEAHPAWMILSVLPVIPPGLRPMVQLEGGRFATSDLNELYRRVITRNNRLIRLSEIYAPEVIITNEKRMLQEAVDALINNGKRGKKALGANNRPLRSLSDIIKGKQGRFRQNLLGKRVDYSGRSVIVVGPSLKLNQCGLPFEIAIELFQPFIIHELMNQGLASNMKVAKKFIQQNESIIDAVLEKVLLNHPIFLNRAPTLHRLGIQAFEPILVEGRAIKLHPLVCSAFNADFDGDQMAVHIPLSLEAQAEAYLLMLAPYNFLSPATGEPIIVPSQDMILGCYYLTVNNIQNLNGSSHYFANLEDVILAYNQGKIDLHSSIWVRYDNPNHLTIPTDYLAKHFLSDNSYVEFYKHLQIRKNKDGEILTIYLQTTTGRIIYNYTIQKTLKILE